VIDLRAVHLVGIGGSGMRGLAVLLHQAGVRVTGSDAGGAGKLSGLDGVASALFAAHDASNLPADAEAVVRTTAASEDSPEIAEALRRGIPVLRYAEALGRVLDGPEGYAVAGTHGKGTTTTMLVHVLRAAGCRPTHLVGGDPIGLEGSARLERGPSWVAEACEYQRAFLNLHPRTIVVTNVDDDHLDYYAGLSQIRAAFREFLASLPPERGLAIVPQREARFLARGVPEGVGITTYGTAPRADVRALQVRAGRGGYGFRIHHRGKDLGRFRLAVPGRHQVGNALAAAAAALETGVAPDAVRDGLRAFRGLRRRLEVLGTFGGVTVVDDYAHHPTAIEAGLRTAREHLRPQRIVVAFQPHLYSRTRLLLEDFARALAGAERAIVLDIYASREREEESRSVSSLDLVLAIRRHGGNAEYCATLDEARERLEREVRTGDLVLVQGAGDATELAHGLVRVLRKGA
jgi:UDP-N-acetylmuramate--alanine ligase